MTEEYKVFGVSDTLDVLLHTAASRSEAVRWVESYTRNGRFGGYNAIRVDCVDETGSYTVYLTQSSDFIP